MTAVTTTLSFGHYNATWGGVDIGITDGPMIARGGAAFEAITADNWGDMVIEGIYRAENHFMLITLKEWTATTQSLFFPHSAASPGTISNVGSAMTGFGKILILTAETGSQAASVGPLTITAEIALPEGDRDIPFGNVARDVPIVFRLWPYVASGGEDRVFELTAPV